ncbi:MAG: NAD(P)-dependent oxidoreductase [Oscillospiraceae bacterium]|nr:NAD(P)-dependent oxidoreductase [Oscillospiraceae bacterium]
MKKAVITGANGFVGRHVAKAAADSGYYVYAVIREGTDPIDKLLRNERIMIVRCDMDHYASLPEMIRDQIDVFFHFAWDGSAGSKRGDGQCQLNNISRSCDAVEAAARLSCSRFVFAGSIMEYEIETMMQTEQAPPLSTLYCTAKKTADYMCRTIANARGLSYVCGLISNIYGPGERSPRLINTSIRKLLNGEHAAFSAGDQLYDFIYITDAAKCFVAIGEKGHNNKTYYIGSRAPKPLKEFLLALGQIVAPGVKLGLGELPFHGVSLTYQEFDVDAVYTDCGVEPEVPFREGISRTTEWIRQEG